MKQANIGVIGVAPMGSNLALNIESRGYTVAVWNRTGSKTKRFVQKNSGKNLIATYTLKDLVKSIKKPRNIVMMIKAGKPTDIVINKLIPLLDKGDTLVDGGNTPFKDTIARNKKLDKSGINFIGMGVSGGTSGARFGPALMPGGQYSAYKNIKPILDKIAAKTPDGRPTEIYCGPNGAGHYVKMVHNGIEYADEELIGETYTILRHLCGLSVDKIAAIFKKWNKGELDSYLIDIFANLLAKKDKNGKPVVDIILDEAENKGTGKWSSEDALNLGVPQSIITEAVYARFVSMLKDERADAKKVLNGPSKDEMVKPTADVIENCRKALYFGKVISYAQGFEQLRFASKYYNWNYHFDQIAVDWEAGCIIRAKLLQPIEKAFKKNPKLPNLLLDPYFAKVANKYQDAARKISALAMRNGVAIPCFSSAVSYFDEYRTPTSPNAACIQMMRDTFGDHGVFFRNDIHRQGTRLHLSDLEKSDK
ncbi:MAG: NADP-dependent phosphogluconate dehydrogenase [Acetilactobacillus jinshanensis]